VKRFLFWCAGCVPDVIRDCPSEHPKYVSLGGTILATWVLAALSGGYAASVVFADSQYVWQMTIGIAVIWGWMLVNIDSAAVAGNDPGGHYRRSAEGPADRAGLRAHPR
jgi:hypothetical protein